MHLLKAGPAAVDPLNQRAKEPERQRSGREAIGVLGRTKDLRAVNPLIASLNDEDPIVCFRATVALKDIRDPRRWIH